MDTLDTWPQEADTQTEKSRDTMWKLFGTSNIHWNLSAVRKSRKGFSHGVVHQSNASSPRYLKSPGFDVKSPHFIPSEIIMPNWRNSSERQQPQSKKSNRSRNNTWQFARKCKIIAPGNAATRRRKMLQNFHRGETSVGLWWRPKFVLQYELFALSKIGYVETVSIGWRQCAKWMVSEIRLDGNRDDLSEWKQWTHLTL